MLNLFQHLILYQLLTLHSELLIVLEPTVGIEPTLKSLPMTRFTTKLCRLSVLREGIAPPKPFRTFGLQPNAIATPPPQLI